MDTNRKLGNFNGSHHCQLGNINGSNHAMIALLHKKQVEGEFGEGK